MNLRTAITTATAERTRRGIAAVFLAQHALSAADAVPFVPGSPVERREFDRLLRLGAVREQGDRRYWLDRRALQADEDARRRVLVPLVVVLLLIAGMIPLFFYRG